MVSDNQISESQDAAGNDGVPESTQSNQPTQRIPKRRTKTGCLTCRQRRIKCGEEKPVCSNCVKSKRECKGYAQRLVFKNPLGIFGPSNSQQSFNAQAQTQPPPPPPSAAYGGPAFSQQRPAGSQQPPLAPMPTVSPAVEQQSVPASSAPLREAAGAVNQQPPLPYQQGLDQTTYTAPQLPETLRSVNQVPSFVQEQETTKTSEELFPSSSHFVNAPTQNLASSTLESGSSTFPASAFVLQGQEENFAPLQPAEQTSQYPNISWTPKVGLPLHPQDSSLPPVPQLPYHVAYADEEGDDYYDVETDEEEGHNSAPDFSHMSLVMASANQDERQLRSFTTYLNEPNVLGNYRPTFGSSPLNNPKTARIFLHFIHATGPSLSIYERHPIDPSTMLGTRVPAAQQGLWTYTLPSKALDNPALLQAILALSSLNISVLQQTSPTVSFKHYHYALKRIGRAVGLPLRRIDVGTLAATLLLGYYEVMSADHTKWNSHLAGAAQLVREIDYAGLTRHLRAQRRGAWSQYNADMSLASSYRFHRDMSETDPFAEKESSIDENLIGSIIGRAVNYDQFGQVDDGRTHSYRQPLTRKDIENFRIQCDMYWWYFKQDALQSMISGSALFMPFSLWAQCPPRAGFSRLDAIYGSADHIWLLLGRIADFGHRDRKRKLKALRGIGSEWKPNSEFFKFMARFAAPGARRPGPAGPGPGGQPHGGPQPAAQPPRGNPSSGPPKGGPQFYGMVPSSGSRRPPSYFSGTTPLGEWLHQDEDEEMMSSYEEAQAEWESIREAFDAFAAAMGPDFMPLPPDSAPPIYTPFGPALQYRTHTIAVLWGEYYAGRMLLHRLHPCMPPAMMVAAGAAAATTAEFAQTVGKIAAGIYYPQTFNVEAGHLSPTLGSCLIEIMVPIYFAAVQYSEIAQRVWIVTKLRDVHRLTGFKTAETIANGCETAWRMAFLHGRGPPYDGVGGSAQTAAATGMEGRTSDNAERRYVPVGKADGRFAMGILSLEQDMDKLELQDHI